MKAEPRRDRALTHCLQRAARMVTAMTRDNERTDARALVLRALATASSLTETALKEMANLSTSLFHV